MRPKKVDKIRYSEFSERVSNKRAAAVLRRVQCAQRRLIVRSTALRNNSHLCDARGQFNLFRRVIDDSDKWPICRLYRHGDRPALPRSIRNRAAIKQRRALLLRLKDRIQSL